MSKIDMEIFHKIQNKIQRFGVQLQKGLEEEKKLDRLDLEGKTWNVFNIEGKLLGRGIRELQLASNSQDERLFIQE